MDGFFNSDVYLKLLLENYNDDKGRSHGRISGGESTLAFLQELDLSAGDRVLEVGCGVGRVMKLLRDDFGVDVYGCDVSQAALDHLREHRPEFASRVWHLDSYGLSLYPVATFDAALYWGVFELVPQATHLMQLSSVLKLGGKVLLGSVKPLASKPDDEIARAARAAYEAKEYPINLTSIAQFEAQVSYLGFQVSKRLVFERRQDVTERKFSTDQGGSDLLFGEAVYILEKVRETPLSTPSNTYFGARPYIADGAE